MLAECYRVALWGALTRPRCRQMEPQAEAIGMMDSLTQDARYAGRMLLKNPGFTSVAVLALALSIGANAAIFSLIDNLFVRPLPYAHADSLIRVWGQSTDGRQQRLPASVPKFEHLRRSQHSSVALAADGGLAVAMTGVGDQPQHVIASVVTDNYIDVLGVSPIAGRRFLRGEEDRAPVVVITRQFWGNRLLSDPNAVGRTLTFDSRAYTVVGIVNNLPASDVGRVEAFLPMPVELSGLTPELRQRGVSYLRITGRLNPDVTIEQARAEAALLAERYRDENREKADSSLRETVISIREDLTGNVRPAILTLSGRARTPHRVQQRRESADRAIRRTPARDRFARRAWCQAGADRAALPPREPAAQRARRHLSTRGRAPLSRYTAGARRDEPATRRRCNNHAGGGVGDRVGRARERRADGHLPGAAGRAAVRERRAQGWRTWHLGREGAASGALDARRVSGVAVVDAARRRRAADREFRESPPSGAGIRRRAGVDRRRLAPSVALS
jgi:hypothetical protein